jgi:hypothetical protein
VDVKVCLKEVHELVFNKVNATICTVQIKDWFFSISSFVIPSKCLKNFVCADSKLRSSLFFSIQASLPNFNAALAVML